MKLKDLYIGLDLGGTFIKYAIGMADGSLLYHNKKPSLSDREQSEIFYNIFALIEELKQKAKELQGEIKAIGFGSPGAINFDEGRLIGSTPNIKSWTDADIRGKIESKFNLPTWVDNDANLMVFAEARQGIAKGEKNVIALTLGTGIGGGILINNQVYRGDHFAGSELGHMSINFDGPRCDCGGIGCIEQYASAPAMEKNYEKKLIMANKSIPDDLSTVTLFERAGEREKEAIDTINDTAVYLGTALANIANIFNPAVIVIGGGVSAAGKIFINKIDAEMRRRAMPPSVRHLKVLAAKLGNSAGMIGAIRLAAEMYAKR
jgi:glucokinase